MIRKYVPLGGSSPCVAALAPDNQVASSACGAVVRSVAVEVDAALAQESELNDTRDFVKQYLSSDNETAHARWSTMERYGSPTNMGPYPHVQFTSKAEP